MVWVRLLLLRHCYVQDTGAGFFAVFSDDVVAY